MKRSYILIIAASVILFIAAFTNPAEPAHKEAVKSKLTAYLNKRNGKEVPLIALAMIQRTVSNITSCDSYFFFSLTKLTWQGDTKTVGIGVFGNVFTFGRINELAAGS